MSEMFNDIDRYLRGEEVAPPTAVDEWVGADQPQRRADGYVGIEEAQQMSNESLGVPDLDCISSRAGKEAVRVTFLTFHLLRKNASAAARNGVISGLESAVIRKDLDEYEQFARHLIAEVASGEITEGQAGIGYLGINEQIRLKMNMD